MGAIRPARENARRTAMSIVWGGAKCLASRLGSVRAVQGRGRVSWSAPWSRLGLGEEGTEVSCFFSALRVGTFGKLHARDVPAAGPGALSGVVGCASVGRFDVTCVIRVRRNGG
jgi:hypothetical protein